MTYQRDPNREAHRRHYPKCRRRDCDVQWHQLRRIERDLLISE